MNKSELDDPAHIRAGDPSGMFSLLGDFPEQFRRAIDLGQNSPIESIGRPIRNVVITGVGGSAIGGDIIAAVAAAEATVPIAVQRGYTLPACVNEQTLVIVSSYSGNTEETLSAFECARGRGARIVAITTGGALQERCRDAQIPVVAIPAGLPPRAALGYTMVPALMLLVRLGVVPDKTADLEETAFLLESKKPVFFEGKPLADNPAKQLAIRWQGRIPILYGSLDTTAVVAARWRGQIAENAKSLAFSHHLPEMNHNEIVGWSLIRPAAQEFSVVLLRDRCEHLRMRLRIEITREILTRNTSDILEVETEGESLLARLFSLIYLGDYASVYLAILNRVDPTTIEPIDFLKEKMKKSRD
ncbi:MAG: bifunctional phosphoglucose/phosphomannose isomerase [Acidobacteriota bacterium]